MNLDQLSEHILKNAVGTERYIVAIAGPPASGKTTLCLKLCEDINSKLDALCCAIVPMDGFHLSNEKLDILGLRHVKGAPQTFDANGFVKLIGRLSNGNEIVKIPGFDRELDKVAEGDQSINRDNRIIIVEGNYLLLNEPPWDQLKSMFDLSIMLSPEIEVLERRLISRWEHYGHTKEEAVVRALSNDIPNAKYVLANSCSADLNLIDFNI